MARGTTLQHKAGYIDARPPTASSCYARPDHIWVNFDRSSELCRPPASASPQKLTSGPNQKLVAMGQEATSKLYASIIIP